MDYFQTNRKVLCSEGLSEGDFEETKQLLRVVSKIEEEEIVEKHSLDPDFSGDKDFNVLQYFLKSASLCLIILLLWLMTGRTQ
jgi:hypothetical protein